MSSRFLLGGLLTIVAALQAANAEAELFSLSASGTISSNSSGDTSIEVGEPWEFQFVYNVAAPDFDFELTGAPDPTFGRFTNAGAPPALVYFHYQAGDYQVTLDGASDFGPFSNVDITFTVVHALDLNINAPDLFPPLAGGPVSFHADFNAFSAAPIFTSDALPTNTAIGPKSFDASSVTLLTQNGIINSGELSGFAIRAVPAGDTDRDFDVDLDDLNNVRNNFGGTTLGDADGDSDVDLDDLNAVRNNFGVAEGNNVPEPTSLTLASLLAVAGIGMMAVARTSGGYVK